MYYGALKKCDIANGAGVRVTLFVSGCTNHCPDCFQPQTWDFCYGRPFTHETETEIFRELDKPFISGLTVLGVSGLSAHCRHLWMRIIFINSCIYYHIAAHVSILNLDLRYPVFYDTIERRKGTKP